MQSASSLVSRSCLHSSPAFLQPEPAPGRTARPRHCGEKEMSWDNPIMAHLTHQGGTTRCGQGGISVISGAIIGFLELQFIILSTRDVC